MEPLLGSGMGMCRCCATEGSFKGLTTKFIWMGEEEVYFDMLRDCFDVTLPIPDEGPEGGICEVCITQLRNAANFKRQVLNTEEQFQRLLQRHAFRPKLVKEELTAEPDEDDIPLSHLSEEDRAQSDGFSSPEYDLPIKSEKEPKRKRKAASRKPKAEPETSAKRIGRETAKVGNVEISVSENTNKINSQTEIDNLKVTKKNKQKNLNKVNGSPKLDFIIREIDKHIHNIRKILLCTNGTPIKTFDGLGYTCGFCSEESSYATLRELKEHTIATHSDKEKKYFADKAIMSTFVVKLDVTDFKCLLCERNIDLLEDMMKHLTSEHGKKLYLDIKNHILPVRFEDDMFSCVICSKKIVCFKVMIEHLNLHYKNYSCNVCEASFVTSRTLRAHVARHKRGDFPCKECAKVFGTKSKRDLHESSVHAGNTKRNKCPICLEKFSTKLKKMDHMVDYHGMERTYYKCHACDKSFVSKGILTTHTKRIHLMERKYACKLCDKRFYSSNLLKNHLLSHTGMKAFQCDVCRKLFGRKSTLREHMRIHMDERRFKCKLCRQTFVQKCSWKSHLRTRHSIVVGSD